MTNAPTLTHLLLLGLASARITSLIVLDDIVEPIRHQLYLRSAPPDDIDRGLAYQGYGRARRNPGIIGSLLACYQCVGVWVAAMIVAAYSLWPEATLPVILVAAVAQISDTTIKASR